MNSITLGGKISMKFLINRGNAESVACDVKIKERDNSLFISKCCL
jgi:hypothetical protein